MHVPGFIERKRDGAELPPESIEEFIQGFTRGEIPDYQVSAWAMAVYFRGMTPMETRALTQSMLRSGEVLKHPAGCPPVVDKHSTGGVGDKISLILAPLLACDDLWVPMISGRGLGITGGTLDKLESIPGFNVSLPLEAAKAQLRRIGVFMIGQTADICPADKKLYALRDVTATVPSAPLITASIMSKKLAEGLDRLVLDVKWGSGAFMPAKPAAKALASGLIAVGREMGVDTSYLLSPMNEPVGASAGNALEVAEAVEVLRGGGPPDVVRLTLALAEKVSSASREKLAGWLSDGTAWRKFVSLVEAQGGDARTLERLTEVHHAPLFQDVCAPKTGVLEKMDAGHIGRACIALGAGRSRASDTVDFAVGCSRIRKTGVKVDRGEPLLRVHARRPEGLEAALLHLRKAIAVR